jgi:hypothetical protein
MATYTRSYLLHSLSHMVIKRSQAHAKLAVEVGKSQDVLIQSSTVFPFTLFPDTLTVDRIKVTIAKRHFFKVATMSYIRIEDILSVTPNFGPFFASLKIISNAPADNDSPYTISYLPRNDALKINRILKGYRIVLDKNIDVSALTNEELVATLDKLSEDGTDK